LLAEFVCGNSIKLIVALDRNNLRAIGVKRVIGAFSQKIETILFQVSEEIMSFDRHAQPLWAVAQ